MSIRDAILAQYGGPHTKRQRVDVFGRDDLYVHEMTAGEKDALEDAYLAAQKSAEPYNYRGRLLAITLHDADGNRVFGEEGDETVAAGLPTSEVDKVLEVAKRVNAIGDDDEQELAGNS